MKSFLKTISLVGCLSLFAYSAVVAEIPSPISSEKALKEDAFLFKKVSYPINKVQNVKVSTSGGSIAVTGDATGEATLEMFVRANNNRKLSEREVQEILERDYDISIVHNGSSLEASAKQKKGLNWRNTVSISFVVHTGRDLNTDLITSGGSIQLTGLSGALNFKTSGGSLNVKNVKGTIQGKTSGGSIQVTNSTGNLSLGTSGGSIKMENLNGNLDFSTSGGSIKGDGITGTLSARTSGGSINLKGLDGSVKASTSGGSITAQFAKVTGDIELRTSAGTININLPARAALTLNLRGSKVNTDQLSNFSGTNQKGTLSGKVNGGGTAVNASTSAGNVNLSFQ